MSHSNKPAIDNGNPLEPCNQINDNVVIDNQKSTDSLNIDAAQLHRQVLDANKSELEADWETQSNINHRDDYQDDDYKDDDYQDNVNMVKTERSLALNNAIDNAMTLQTIRDFIRFCVTQLRGYDIVIAQGTSDVFAEAAAIVLHTLNLEWSADEQILDCRLTEIEKSEVLNLLQQRIESRKPLSYLINLAYFCGLPFYVDERVLIPRSPIAELIKQQFYPYFQVNQLAQPLNVTATTNQTSLYKEPNSDTFFNHGLPDKRLLQPMQILDLCTGSGCIAVALATRFPEAQVDAADIDQAALEVACLNVEHHELNYQINIIESDLFAKLPSDEHYDLIVTNPPYVDAASMADLPPEFLYEPEHALAAGQDGLDLVHYILYQAPDYLSAEGLLVCEVGDSEWALRQAYPEIEFDWLTFAFGGSGVFAIDKDMLLQYKSSFAKYVAILDAKNA